MTLDKNFFSVDQAVTETADSTNKMRFPVAHGNIGDGQSVRIYVQVTEDFETCTSVQVTLQSSPDDSTWTTVLSGPVVLVADAVAGKVLLEVTVPKGMTEYHKLNYVIDGSNATAGKITAGYMPLIN